MQKMPRPCIDNSRIEPVMRGEWECHPDQRHPEQSGYLFLALHDNL
jgi:hypothetical protein